MRSDNVLELEAFKRMVKTSLMELFGDVKNSGIWGFKVFLSRDNFIKVDIKKVWDSYSLTKDANLLLEFIETQCEIVMSLNNDNKKNFEDIKGSIFPSVRSEELINKMNTGSVIKTKEFLKGFEKVVLYEQKRYSQILNREQFDSLPNDKAVFEYAMGNLKEKGWSRETKIFDKEACELLFFDSSAQSIHYQFFIKEWIDKHLGDCYIAFPTSKFAVVLRLKTDDWRDWVKSLNFYSRLVKESYLKDKNALSQRIIKYENGEYEVI